MNTPVLCCQCPEEEQQSQEKIFELSRVVAALKKSRALMRDSKDRIIPS